MPLLINEVIAEIEHSVTEPVEQSPSAEQQPLSVAEIEIAQTLDRIQQRNERLKVD
jgi:hypothetical protein